MDNINRILSFLQFLVPLTLGFSSINTLRNLDTIQEILHKNPSGLRIFHPAFPSQVLNPISQTVAQNIFRVKELTGSVDNPFDLTNIPELPWKIFPEVGITDSTNFKSKSDLLELYEINRHKGQFVW